MTDWKPGDRFKLECEGQILGGTPRGCIEVDHGGVEDLLETSLLYDPTWFDAHATKIPRGLLFGDLVLCNTRQAVVIDSGPSITTVWVRGDPTSRTVKTDRIVLVEPVGAT